MARSSNIEEIQNENNDNHENNNDDELTPNQTEMLLQFQDLTSLEDLNHCRSLLQDKNWNIEEAVRNYYFEVQDIDQEHRDDNNHSSVLNHNSSLNSLSRSEDIVPTPPGRSTPTTVNTSASTLSNQQQLTLFNFIPRLITFSFHTIYDSFLRIIRFAWSLIRPDPRRFIVDPVEDVTNFIQSYNDTYGSEHPTFYLGTYSQALNDAKRELKFLLVYLHSEDHQDTNDFCLNVLSHTEVINYINRNNLLFWACSVKLPEGFRVSQALHENTYPFLALVVLKETRMTVVRRFEGKTTVERFLSLLQQGIENNQASLIAARLDRQERNMTHILRKEQDQAYYESLKIDQEKERKKKEEQKRKDELLKLEKEKKLNELNRIERIKKLKGLLVKIIPDEPNSDDNDAIKLSIKLPNGQRLERKFLKNQSLKYLYYFVFSNDENLINFKIVTNFPRKELPGKSPMIPDNDDELNGYSNENNFSDIYKDPDNENLMTFNEFGLGRSEMLFVHDLEA